MKTVAIRGKRGRGVPVLFNPEVQNHIDTLLAVRNEFVPRDNPYLFAPVKSSSHLISYKILGEHAKLSVAKDPTYITSARLRKHLATLSQLLNLSDGEIEQLATFMGYRQNYRSSYRLPDDIYQTTKIAKLLMVMEKGTANKFKGKSLDEVEIDMDKNILEDNFSESDVDVDDELKCWLHDDTEPSTSQIRQSMGARIGYYLQILSYCMDFNEILGLASTYLLIQSLPYPDVCFYLGGGSHPFLRVENFLVKITTEFAREPNSKQKLFHNFFLKTQYFLRYSWLKTLFERFFANTLKTMHLTKKTILNIFVGYKKTKRDLPY
ncbi:uncharacterized protein LOC126883861 [Diabrotica virgifera virgifera]|uniref:Uncharacterized protein n=1 Tax=Diabrotica virgifera virgifera TaxID=50390 RepID=A0ABM5K5M3_DIAVI|nr:uncharacterized protein LOC126883861 [Diabrotica virgifera virgifera]